MNITNLNNKWLWRDVTRFSLKLLEKYFRLEVEGLENIPRKGRAILTSNHSGFSGLDALILCHQVYQNAQRIPRVLTHPFWFWQPWTAFIFNKMGFIEANFENAISHLRKNKMLLIFPEGEVGNFKPSTKAYSLQEFRKGFVRMSLLTQSPIVPTLIIGAEESHINLAQIRLDKRFGNLILPLPLNLIPLPSRWKIVFMPPIHWPYKAEAASDFDLLEELSTEVHDSMQERLNMELNKRSSVYF